nr:reverse transcriptase domain-containing protein [Tanacetum cinerariifolium]
MTDQTSTVPQVISQVAYQSPQAPTQLMIESPFIDLGFAVSIFSPRDDPIAYLNKAMAFLTAVAFSRFPSTNNQLRTSSNTRNQATIQDGRVTLQQVQGRQGQNYSITTYKGNATSSRGNTTSGQARVEKAILAEAQEAGQILDEEQLAFLVDPGIPVGQAQTIIPQDATFQTEDLDTYDSDSDDLSTAQAVLIANVSNYGSDVISEQETKKATVQDTNLQVQQDSMILSVNEQIFEQMINHVNNWKTANKEQNNKSITVELEIYKEMVKTFEQRLNIDLSSHEKMIDSQMDDMIREKLALKEQVDSLEENLSKQIKEKESLFKTFTVFQNESKEKENKYMENEINLEKKIKELDNVIYKVGQSAQTVHMLTKPQSFYDNVHKQALGYQNPFYLKKAQRIKPTLYDGIVISEKHVAMHVIDDEETLILEEESRSKMSKKEKVPEVIKQNISHKPIDYEKLNRLTEDFGKCFTPQQELSAEQAFWLCIYNPTIESSSTPPVRVEVPSELPKSIDAGSHSGVYGRRFEINGRNTSNDMSGERHDMIEDDAGNALLYVWSWGHTRGETNACCTIFCRCNSPSVAEDLLEHRKVTEARNCFNKLAPSVGPYLLNHQEFRMTGPTPITLINRTNTNTDQDGSPDLQDQILSHISSLKALVQKHNESPTGLLKPIRISFDNEGGPEEEHDEELKDLRKPYKEVLKSPFSRRIIEFSAPKHQTPTNLKIYDSSTDPDNHITRFVGAANQGEWKMHDPTEVTKIIKRANETLPIFKERWTEEMRCIPDVPVVMQISAFMSNSKCPELARHFSDQVPQTVAEMMRRLDDFVKLEEVFKNTEPPKGEHPERPTIAVEEDIDTDVLADIKVDATTVEVAVDRDVEAGVDAGNCIEVDVGVDVEDEVEGEVESSDRGTMKVGVDVVAEIDILDGMLIPDVVEHLEQVEEVVQC